MCFYRVALDLVYTSRWVKVRRGLDLLRGSSVSDSLSRGLPPALVFVRGCGDDGGLGAQGGGWSQPRRCSLLSLLSVALRPPRRGSTSDGETLFESLSVCWLISLEGSEGE